MKTIKNKIRAMSSRDKIFCIECAIVFPIWIIAAANFLIIYTA